MIWIERKYWARAVALNIYVYLLPRLGISPAILVSDARALSSGFLYDREPIDRKSFGREIGNMSEGLNIIVCIKQVPETTEVDFDEETGRLIREGVAAVINPFDEYAIEEGIRLKEKFGGTVKVLSMGPPQAESALKDAIAIGADEAFLATDRAFAGADTWATSYTLGLAIEKLAPYDLVICGLKTIDGDTGQVGPELAHQLAQIWAFR